MTPLTGKMEWCVLILLLGLKQYSLKATSQNICYSIMNMLKRFQKRTYNTSAEEAITLHIAFNNDITISLEKCYHACTLILNVNMIHVTNVFIMEA